MTKPNVAIDFDGVLNTYTGWKGVDELFEPREGAARFLDLLTDTHRVVIFSTRDSEKIWEWLKKHDMDRFVAWVTNEKIPASAYVDDRAVRFDGDFTKALGEVRDFRPHWQEPVG